MGSGCNSNSIKKKNCFPETPDVCVTLTIEGRENFNVCQGDRLDETLDVILDKLEEYATGEGITLLDIVPGCDFVNTFLVGKDKNLFNLVQASFDIGCSLKSLIDGIIADINSPYAFDLKCLTTPANPSRDDILQAVINLECDNKSRIDEIVADLADESDDEEITNSILNSVQDLTGNMLATNINSCGNNIIKTGSGKNTQLNFIGQVPIGTLLFGIYNISSFDNTGLGLASAGMCGFAIANNQNGTTDMRGFTAAGATNIPGPALNALVNPGADPDLVTNIGQTKGKYKYTLVSSQLPNHFHVVTQNPHSHTVNTHDQIGISDNANDRNVMVPGNTTVNTSSTTVDLTVGGVTGTTGQPIDNRPPTRYGMWIQRIS